GQGSQGPGGQGPQGPGSPPYQRQPPGHRGVKALIIALVLAVAVGGGAFAFYKTDPLSLFTGGPQAAEALPGEAVFYLGVDLDPSAEQKVKAVQFLNHFPAFRDNVDVKDAKSDVREAVFAKALESSACTGVTFANDVKPWLGNKFGLAGIKSQDGTAAPDFAFVMEVSSSGEAQDALDKLASCGGSDSDYGIAFDGDYALIAETQELADGFVADAEERSLADSDEFSSDMDSLGDLGVATMWVNIKSAAELLAPSMVADDDLKLLSSSYERAAATFRFDSDSVEVAASVFGDTEDIDHGDNKIVNLPESTVFAVSEAGGRQRIDETWDKVIDAARDGGVDVESQLAEFESQTGLNLPDDLATVLGDNILFAVDQEGLTAEALQSGDPSQVNAGVRFTSDPGDLNAIYAKVLALVQDETGQEDIPVVKLETDDGIVLATNDEYAESLSSDDGALGGTDEFQSVTDDAQSKEFVLFFNFDAIEDQVVEAMQTEGDAQEVIDNITPLQAFGTTTEVDGDYTVTTFRLSVND
ncbi:MAG: DUF3352 domain-containing protein, partial [Propionibacteriales bacterium]|nr:DUF3352 domain-containing protein [Propionibacteriales bacterium]